MSRNFLILGSCDIDFFNFHPRQVRNFEILNQSKWDQNFAVNFQKHQKWKSTKYSEIERNQSILPYVKLTLAKVIP